MLSVVLMTAIAAGSSATTWHNGPAWGCTNAWSHSAPAHVPYGPGFCYGASSWASGCLGCYGGCFGNPYGCHGCYGCYGCYGCTAYTPTVVGVVPTATEPEAAPSPKEKEKDKDKEKEKDKEKKTGSIGNSARLIVELPADAKLYVDNLLTTKTNSRRVFETPQLSKGTAYYYVLRAEVTRDGETYKSTKRVIVRGGDQVTASFNDLDKVNTAKAEQD